MTSTILVGSTGLVGSTILSGLLVLPSIASVHALTRRTPATSDPKLTAIIETDSAKWAPQISSLQPPPSIYFSALGTTRGQAGSFENQRKIDYDLNLALATAARDAGVRVCVMISVYSADAKGRVPYSKMKGELDEAIKALGFEKTVILKPGLILGTREDSRPAEAVLRGVARVFGSVSSWLVDGWAQDAQVIGRAAIAAGLRAEAGEGAKVEVVLQSDIVRLGKTDFIQ